MRFDAQKKTKNEARRSARGDLSRADKNSGVAASDEQPRIDCCLKDRIDAIQFRSESGRIFFDKRRLGVRGIDASCGTRDAGRAEF